MEAPIFQIEVMFEDIHILEVATANHIRIGARKRHSVTVMWEFVLQCTQDAIDSPTGPLKLLFCVGPMPRRTRGHLVGPRHESREGADITLIGYIHVGNLVAESRFIH